MPIFLTVFEGDSPAQARPVVATSDPAIIAVVRRLLWDRLAEAPTSPVLHLQRRQRSPHQGKDQQSEPGA